jgi:hypothetical protein
MFPGSFDGDRFCSRHFQSHTLAEHFDSHKSEIERHCSNKQQRRTTVLKEIKIIKTTTATTNSIPESNIMIYQDSIEVQKTEHGAVEIQQQEESLRAADGDLQEEANLHRDARAASTTTTTTITSATTDPSPFTFVPLRMGGNGRTHEVSEGSRRLIQQVGLANLEKMTKIFYENAFQDATLDQFIRSHNDPHESRFVKWIHQKLSGSTVWDQDRYARDLEPVRLAGGHSIVVHDRSSAHVAAWNSVKRPATDHGRHFELDESRVWMRLHFWALRESGLLVKAPSFADYYVRFIGHFVRVYEGSAPRFARDSFRWSANPANIEKYIENGRRMDDVLGLSLKQAARQIPASESEDTEWPYNQTQQDPSNEPELF